MDKAFVCTGEEEMLVVVFGPTFFLFFLLNFPVLFCCSFSQEPFESLSPPHAVSPDTIPTQLKCTLTKKLVKLSSVV